MIKIITALGNPILNENLKNENNFEIISKDIQYQEGIFEILEKIKEIDFLILSEILDGKDLIEELINKIKNINNKIKIIVILEKQKEELENILYSRGIYKIYYNNEVEIKDIINLINKNNYSEEKELKRELENIKQILIKNNIKIENENIIKNNNYNKNLKLNINKMSYRNCEEKNYKKINYILKNNENKKEKNNYDKINSYKELNEKNYKNHKQENYEKTNYLLKNNNINNYNKLNNYIGKNNFKKVNKINNNENKVISISGTGGVGKSITTINIANILSEKNKILIIDFDILNNSLHTILGVNKYPEKIKKKIKSNNLINSEIKTKDLIIKINKNIDLVSGLNLIFDFKYKISSIKIKNIINELKQNYSYIIIDTSSECFFDYTKEIIKNSDFSIFLLEANLIEIEKSKRLLDIYNREWKIDKNKIKLLINKTNEYCVDEKIIENIFYDFKILGRIKYNKKYNLLINKNYQEKEVDKNLKKEYKKISEKIIKIKNTRINKFKNIFLERIKIHA